MSMNINERVIHRGDDSVTIAYNIPGTGSWVDVVKIPPVQPAEQGASQEQNAGKAGARGTRTRTASTPARSGKKV